VSTSGSVTEFPLPAGISPGPIAAGPDGALWFIAYSSSCNQTPSGCTTMIDRITTAGVVTNQFSVPVTGNVIAAGPDGGLWFFSSNSSMGRLSTDGTFTQYPLPAGCCSSGPVLGPDGALWFDGSGWTGRITASGTITQFGSTGLGPINFGPDGAFWAFENGILDGLPPTLTRFTIAGAVSKYTLTSAYAGHAHLVDMAAGPDGALWITDANSSGVIGAAILRVGITPAPVISGSGPPLGALGSSYSATLSTTGGTPPYSNWTVSNGSLPPGLTLDPATGTIQGVATSAGTFNFSVTAQDSAGVTSAPQIVSITIDAPVSGLSLVGSMPHVAAEENWTMWFTLVNKGTDAATARLSLFGDPSGTLPLPLTFPQLPAGANSVFTASIDRTIAGNASLIVQTAGPQTPPVHVGSAQLSAAGTVDGFAIFHHVITQQETVVPVETRNASSYMLAFDNTGGNVLGVAVASLSAQSASVSVVIRDDNGALIQTASIGIQANGHLSFVLPIQYPVTADARGTIEFDSPSGGQISVLGMRFTPPNNALTTIPALVPGGAGGGSIAHIATGNGWQTTFVLVNTSATAAPFQLNFFADNGSPLAIPVGYPQTSSGTAALVSSVSQTLAAGATLIVESAAPESDPTPTIGSAQLTSSGNVSGFVIFRYDPNGQEAVVPFENRTASGYILAFDNTAATATGVAVNSVSAQAADVPVVIRDDSGAVLANDTIHLAPNGHLAFTLATDRYPVAANIRGTIEFDTPPGGQIGALALRIPVAHTFTALPALVK